MLSPSEQFVFDLIIEAARAGKRCPQRTEFVRGHIDLSAASSNIVCRLARFGWLKIEISGRNYRTVEILKGPDKGCRTMMDPSGAVAWKVIPSLHADLARLKRAQRLPTAQPVATLPPDFKVAR